MMMVAILLIMMTVIIDCGDDGGGDDIVGDDGGSNDDELMILLVVVTFPTSRSHQSIDAPSKRHPLPSRTIRALFLDYFPLKSILLKMGFIQYCYLC